MALARATSRLTHDERDAEDARLLSVGDHDTLLAAYLPVVETRVRARVRDASADDVVQNVMLRLCAELERGRSYAVPFRVVVHQVTGWLIGEHFQGRDLRAVPFPESFDPVGDEDVEVDDPRGFERLLDGLAPREREVVELRYGQGLEIADIADRLGMERNAVDQALHRALERLRRTHANG